MVIPFSSKSRSAYQLLKICSMINFCFDVLRYWRKLHKWQIRFTWLLKLLLSKVWHFQVTFIKISIANQNKVIVEIFHLVWSIMWSQIGEGGGSWCPRAQKPEAFYLEPGQKWFWLNGALEWSDGTLETRCPVAVDPIYPLARAPLGERIYCEPPYPC